MRKYRYFIDFINHQENWLNKMAKKGYRLTGITRVSYDFEPCEFHDYTYVVQYVADKTREELSSYRSYLDDMNYVYYEKNMNIQNGYRAKIRYNGKRLHVATNPGLLNKELLIIEVPTGHTLDIFTTAYECYKYYAIIRNIFAAISVSLLFMTFFGRTKVEAFGHVYVNEQFLVVQLVCLCISIQFIISTIRFTYLTTYWRRESRIHE